MSREDRDGDLLERGRELSRRLQLGEERAATVAALIELGVSEDTVRNALDHGSLQEAVFEPLLSSTRRRRTVSPAEIAARGGRSVEETRELIRAFGLPSVSPDDPAFTEEEASVLVELAQLDEIWPHHVALQVARVYGQALAHIARAETQIFRLYIERRLAEHSAGPTEQLAAVRDAVERLLPLADPIILGVHRRWLEHELAQEVVRQAETQGGDEALAGAVEVTFLFVDLKDFTAYAESRGDAAAVAAIDRFSEIVAEEGAPRGQIVKALGDGFMLAYADPREAVRTGGRVVDRMRREDAPGVHASAHRGVALYREGDFFGREVNLAARLLANAAADELVATASVAEPTSAEFGWQPRGVERIRGISQPVEVFRLLGPRPEAT